MNLQLTSEDGRAVDLLLDRAATAKRNGNGHGQEMVYAVSDPSLGQRVTGVQKLLHLLDAMPASEASADLTARTIDFVQHPEHRQPVTPGVSNLFGGQRPVA